QYHPGTEWLVGFTPHLRYNFATGTRWVPFIDGGAGVTATSIGRPDLSVQAFQFNLQGGFGMQYFVSKDLSLNLEAQYLHISDAGIHKPNNGLNTIPIMIGVSYFF